MENTLLTTLIEHQKNVLDELKKNNEILHELLYVSCEKTKTCKIKYCTRCKKKCVHDNEICICCKRCTGECAFIQMTNNENIMYCIDCSRKKCCKK